MANSFLPAIFTCGACGHDYSGSHSCITNHDLRNPADLERLMGIMKRLVLDGFNFSLDGDTHSVTVKAERQQVKWTLG
jgi:hypothetical protein